MIWFVPILTADAVIFCKEEEPCTTKLLVMNNDPVIVCVPKNTFEPVVARVSFKLSCDCVNVFKADKLTSTDAVYTPNVLFLVSSEALNTFRAVNELLTEPVYVPKVENLSFTEPV